MDGTIKFEKSVCNNAAAKRASRALGHFYDTVLAPSGLKATQHALLQQIDRLGSPSMTDLATALVLDRSALSHTLRPLERDNLIAIQGATTDRRIKLVTLTETGREKLAACNGLWKKAQLRFEQTFGAEEAALLRGTMDLLASLDFTARRRSTRAA